MAVPDTNDFTLNDVVLEISPTSSSLSSCFTDATAGLFDPTYEGAKDRLSNFRNYGAGGGKLNSKWDPINSSLRPQTTIYIRKFLDNSLPKWSFNDMDYNTITSLNDLVINAGVIAVVTEVDDAAWVDAATVSDGIFEIVTLNNNGTTSTRIATFTLSSTGYSDDQVFMIQKEDETAVSPTSLIMVSPNELQFTAGAGTKSFTVTSDDPWTTSNVASWVTLSQSAGNSGDVVEVTVTANTGASRENFITLDNSGGGETVLVIKQQGTT